MDIYEYAIREFEKHYDSTMTVQLFGTSQDDDDPFSDGDWQDYLTDVPCRIAQKNQQTKAESANYVSAESSPFIYCNPLIVIPVGSRIFVTDRHGKTEQYERSGDSFSSYASHQELKVNRVVKA